MRSFLRFALVVIGGYSLSAIVAPAPITAQAIQKKRPYTLEQLEEALLICRDLEDSIRRLSCFDGRLAVVAETRADMSREPIASYEGTGQATLALFTAPGPWQAEWEANVVAMQIYLRDHTGALLGVIAEQRQPGAGKGRFQEGGTYQIQVVAIGSWKIDIFPADDITSR